MMIRFAVIVGLFIATACEAQAETMREALLAAIEQSPKVRAQALAVDALQTDVSASNAARLPNIDFQADYENDFVGTAAGESLSLSLGLTQNLFDNGKTDALVNAAKARVRVERIMQGVVQQDVLLAAARAYSDVFRTQAVAKLREEAVGYIERQVGLQTERIKAGEGTLADKSKAQISLAGAVADYQSALAESKTANALYHNLIGHQPEGLQYATFSALIPRTLDEAVKSAASSNFTMRLALAKQDVASQNLRAAKAAFGPSLDLSGKVGAAASGGGFAPDLSLKLSLSVPIFSGGETRANAQKANFELTRSQVEAVGAQNDGRQAVIAAWNALTEAKAQVATGERSIQAARAWLSASNEAHRSGELTLIDVLDAKSALTSANEARVTAQAAQMTAEVTLLAALGVLDTNHLKFVGPATRTAPGESKAGSVEGQSKRQTPPPSALEGLQLRGSIISFR